jgi:serine/threonine protein kinase
MNNAEFEYLGPYHVDRVLGRGGMGSVYKALHSQSGQVVAVKVIATGIANQSRFRRRFAAEVEALKRLKHPNIVELIGYGEEKGMLFYSMEYVDGNSLHEHLRHKGTLPWQQVVQIAIETTSALKHAHNIGIIHRDLKPANLMLSSAGQIKLTDFGISKLFGSSDETAAGAVMGTADYMPPEQAEGKPVNVRSDLYSLGCVMYALLTGKAPFGGKSVPEVLYAVRYNPVPSLASLVSNVPNDLIALIHELLEKDPMKRPPTALVVGNRLKALQKGMEFKTSSETAAGDEGKGAATANVIGKQLTSLDLSDVDDEELKLTGAENSELGLEPDADKDAANETRRGEMFGTHEQQTLLAPDHNGATMGGQLPTESSKEYALEDSQESPTPPSSNMRSGGSTGEYGSYVSQGEITSGGPSHYTPVSDTSPSKFAFDRDEPTPEPTVDWVQVGSIAGMLVLLLGSIVFGWWMLLPKSADRLYGSIAEAVDSGDDGQLLEVNGDIDSFLERFPADERHAELQALKDEIELIRMAKLLQRKASRSGGADELNVIEQAFLDCLQTRSRNAAAAKGKFSALIAVFGNVKNLDRGDRRLVELAEFALRVGDQVKLGQEPAAKQELEKLIQAADAALSGEELKSYYRDLLLLYDGKPWADEQINRIRQILESESEG